MKLLQLKTSTGRGGAETLLLDLTAGLTLRGHEVTTLFGEPGWLKDKFQEAGFGVGTVELGARTLFGEARRLARLIRDDGYDVVLAHGARVNLLGSIAATMASRPSVSVEHNVDDWRRSFSVLNWADRIAGRLNTKRIAVSRAVREMLVKQHIVPLSKIVDVPNAVSLPDARPRAEVRKEVCEATGFHDSDFIAVVVERLAPQKGHRFLLDALPLCRGKLPNLRVLVCGEGDLRGALEAYAMELGVADMVYFAGNCDQVHDILQATDAFILPSLWEGMPIALLEAMGGGRPVIATDVAGTPEVVEDGVSGILVRPQDPTALAEAIQRVASDGLLAGRLAAGARSRIARDFSIDTLVDRYEAVLGSVAAAGGRLVRDGVGRGGSR
jgi:glycosyltransferase involved in cell wall biosynthesis